MSTFEKGNQKKIFFVSTFLDWYNGMANKLKSHVLGRKNI